MGFKTTRVPQFWSLNPLFTMWQRQYYGLYHTCNCLAHTVWYNLCNFPDTAKFLWHIHHVPLLPHTFLIPWQFQVSPFCRQVVTLLNACKHYLMKLEEKTKTKIKFIVLRSTSTTDIAAHHSHHCHSCHTCEWHFIHHSLTSLSQLSHVWVALHFTHDNCCSVTMHLTTPTSAAFSCSSTSSASLSSSTQHTTAQHSLHSHSLLLYRPNSTGTSSS